MGGSVCLAGVAVAAGCDEVGGIKGASTTDQRHYVIDGRRSARAAAEVEAAAIAITLEDG